MHTNRVFLLGGILLALFGVIVWRWVAGWGLITVNVEQAPLASVIKTIQRQGDIKIYSNASPDTVVTLHLKKAPVMEALQTLAEAINGDVRVAYLAAPNKAAITEILAAFTTNTNPETWTVFSLGGGGGPMGIGGGASDADPRLLEWKVSEIPEKTLQSVFEQGSQKTGALFATPKDWNPPLAKLPPAGLTSAVAGKAARLSKSQLAEVFLVTVRPPQPEGQRRAANNEGGERWMGNGARTVFSARPNRDRMNPAWMAERMEAQIAQLPADERDAARNLFTEMRALWAEARALPEEERRAKMEELMNRQDVQDAMQARMEARDARSTPERREERFRRYVERKEQIKNRTQPNP